MKKTIICLLTVVLSLVCLTLTSCGCNHEWSEWIVKSEVSCTREGVTVRTCKLCEEKETQTTPATGHSGDDICTVCGIIVYEPDQLLPDYTSADYITLTMENVTVYAVNGIGTLNVNFAELELAVKDNEILGKGSCKLLIDGASLDGEAYIADNKIYYTATKILQEEKTEFYGVADVNTLSANGLDFKLSELEYLLEGALDGLTEPDEALSNAITEWIEGKLAPIFSELVLDVRMAQIQDLINKYVSSLYTFTDSPDGDKTVTLNLSKLKDWNNTVSSVTVADLYDIILGEGKFEELRSSVPSMLTYRLEDFLSYLEFYQGVKIDELLSALDELAVILAEDESATFESLIGYEGDLTELLTDPDMLSVTVADAFVAGGVAPDANSLNESINLLFSQMKITNAYTLFGVSPLDIQKVRDQINDLIDQYSETFSWILTLGSDERFESLVTSITLPAEMTDGANVSAVLTATKRDINLTVTVAIGEGLIVIPVNASFENGEIDLDGLDDLVAQVECIPTIDTYVVTKCGYEAVTDSEGNLIEAIQTKPIDGSTSFFPGVPLPEVTTTVNLAVNPIAVMVINDGSGILEIHLIYTAVCEDGITMQPTAVDFTFRYDSETNQIVG